MVKREKMCLIICVRKNTVYTAYKTHIFTKDLQPIIRSQWGFECYSSFGTSNSRGVSILFNNNFEYKMLELKIDDNGNFLIANIEVENRFTLTLVNIYGPNQDNPDFYRKLNDYISEMQRDYIDVCGDMNLVLDFQNDCFYYKNRNNPRAAEALGTLKNDHSLVDPWKIFHTNAKGYTWFSKNPVKKARLDFFLISESLLSFVDCTRNLPGYKSDHSAITIELKLNNFKKGKGFWKLNNSLLYDRVYVNKVKDKIRETKIKYALPVYNFNNIDEIDEMELQLTISEQTFFDILLMDIRGMTISYSSYKKKMKIERKDQIEKELIRLQEAYQNTDEDHRTNVRILELNNELEQIRNEELKGLFIRSKVRWIEHGEKPTKYFCALEKRNYTNKNISSLVNDQGKDITEQKQILETVKHFYQSLYTSRDETLEEAN